MNEKRLLASYKPVGSRVSETVRRHQPETTGEQNYRGPTSNYNYTKGSISNHSSTVPGTVNHGQMAPVSFVKNWDGHHRVISGHSAKRKSPDDEMDIGSLWHLSGDRVMSIDSVPPPGHHKSKKPRTKKPERSIYDHLAQIKRKQATWYQMEGTQGLESGQSLAADTAANMAQLCLAGEIVHGPSSTVTDSHDQTVPIISVATGGQWFDNKCSMAMRQPWQDYTSATTATRHVSVVDNGHGNEYGPHKMQLGHHSGHYNDPLEADMMATISLRTVDTTRREETAKTPSSLFGQGHDSPREATDASWDTSSQAGFWNTEDMEPPRLPDPSSSASLFPSIAPPTCNGHNKLGRVDMLAAVLPCSGKNSPPRKLMFGADSNRGSTFQLPTIYELEMRSKVYERVELCSKTSGVWANRARSSLELCTIKTVQSDRHQPSRFIADEE